MLRPKYLSAFDWEWSDELPMESARDQALLNRKTSTRVLAKMSEAHTFIHFALWNALPDGHPVGDLWMETTTDVGATIYLAYGGYFRQALAVLRLWLELSVNGVYYSQPTSRYKKWRSGERLAPTDMKKIAQSLSTHLPGDAKANAKAIQQKLEPLYVILCHHVHGQGLDVYDLQSGRDNVPRFLERSYDLWYECAFKVLDATSYLYRLFYAKELSTYLNGSKSEHLEAISHGKVLEPHAPEFTRFVFEASSLVKAT